MQIVLNILNRYQEIERVVIFGSWARENFKTGSDIDLAIWQAEGANIIFKLNSDFEESKLPYFVDLLDYKMLESDDLKQQIDTSGVEIYPRLLEE